MNTDNNTPLSPPDDSSTPQPPSNNKILGYLALIIVTTVAIAFLLSMILFPSRFNQLWLVMELAFLAVIATYFAKRFR